MKTARQILYEDIRAHRVVTVRELSERLRMTEANARHHLKILQEQGLIEIVGELPSAQSSGRRSGRPRKLYGLSRSSRSSNLANLLWALWQEISGRLSPAEKQTFLQAVAYRLSGANWQAAPPALSSPTPRLVAAIQRLNEMDYQARWEARREGPRIILGNCPYADLARRDPEICHLDFQLLKILTGMEAIQLSRLQPDSRGLPQCLFQLTSPPSRPA